MSAGRPPPERRTFEPCAIGRRQFLQAAIDRAARDCARLRHRAHAPVSGRARLRRREQPPLPFVQTHAHRLETVANRRFINHPAVIAISNNLGNPHPAGCRRSAHIQVDSIISQRRLRCDISNGCAPNEAKTDWLPTLLEDNPTSGRSSGTPRPKARRTAAEGYGEVMDETMAAAIQRLPREVVWPCATLQCGPPRGRLFRFPLQWNVVTKNARLVRAVAISTMSAPPAVGEVAERVDEYGDEMYLAKVMLKANGKTGRSARRGDLAAAQQPLPHRGGQDAQKLGGPPHATASTPASNMRGLLTTW